jgi:hypothetical protein
VPDRADVAPTPRQLWTSFEAVHAVTYFAPECRRALAATGLRGFWMGYFAARAAPLGPVGPALVASTFFNFRPSMVERALPSAWGWAEPADVRRARREGAAAALRKALPSVEEAAEGLVPSIRAAVDTAGGGGLLEGHGLPAAGLAVRDAVESTTDRLGAAAWDRLGSGLVATLAAGLERVASAVTASGVIPFPNPIGLPAPSPVPGGTG